jgi:glycosyltransferase involved in cell wall biosynthesis
LPLGCTTAEDALLKSSLSVVLPVCNDQANLSRRLSSLLEVLPELTGRFEVAVIDHGSCDATAEVAHDVAAGYPQVGVLSYPQPLDGSSVLRQGLQATHGEMVLLLMDPAADPHDLHRLVLAAQATDAVAGRLPPLAGGSLAAGCDAAGQPALLLFNRRVATAWRSTQTDEPLLTYLLRKRYRIAELLVRRSTDKPRPVAGHPVVPPPAMHALRSSKRSSVVPSPRGGF